MRRLPTAWFFALALLCVGLVASPAVAGPPKPEKLPVAFGAWTGKGAGSFKSALRGKIGKECVVVPPKKARALLEGVVTEAGKGVTVKLVVKAAFNGEVVQSKEFSFARPSPQAGKVAQMAKAVVEITRRTPTE